MWAGGMILILITRILIQFVDDWKQTVTSYPVWLCRRSAWRSVENWATLGQTVIELSDPYWCHYYDNPLGQFIAHKCSEKELKPFD